jgi:WD40 repeat protein
LTVLVTTAADKTLKLTSLATGEVEDIFEPHQAAIICVAPHPTEPRLLLTGSMDGT